jgi:hypothetical protein
LYIRDSSGIEALLALLAGATVVMSGGMDGRREGSA